MSESLTSSTPQTYQSFLAALPHPAFLIDRQGKIQCYNERLLTLYKIPAQELLNNELSSLCQQFNIAPPITNLMQLIDGQQNTTTINQQTIQWSASHLDHTIFVIGFDITQFINASRQEKNINTSIIDHIPNHYIFWKDKSSTYLGCNTALAKAVGLNSSAAIIGKTDYDLPTTKEESDAYRADDQIVMQSGQPKLNIEEHQTLADGKTRVISTSKTPLFDDEGKVYGVLAIYSDITEQKDMERSLEKARTQAEMANQAKTEFIVNMSHDIRTPLSGIVGISKLLEDRAQDPIDKQYARWIHASGEQLLDLLNGILDIISADNIREEDLHLESFDLRSCINEIIQLELPMIKMRGLELFVTIDPKIPPIILSDRTKLHRILLNLLGNAIKFTQQGHVKIEVKLQHREKDNLLLELHIIDTGIGIPEELQAKVFDQFYRGNRSFKGTYHGHGVGLHIAQKFVELLNGRIDLQSQTGVGTHFIVTLPVTKGCLPEPKKPENLERQQNLISMPKDQGQLHALLVEDNIIALHLIESIVAQEGLKYTSAIDGETAFDYVKQQDFDLIITDIGLPGMSGCELCKSIRNWEKSHHKPPVPIFGLTAHALRDAEKECLAVGMNKMLRKPIQSTTLQALIKDCLKPTMPSNTLQNKEKQSINKGSIPLLNTEEAIKHLGGEAKFKQVLLMMLEKELPEQEEAFQIAHAAKDWAFIKKIAHKIRGSAVYCCTHQLQYACQDLEELSEYSAQFEMNYQRLRQVLSQTKQAIQDYLHPVY
jgi:PAS domain S-box-containing protein